MTLSLPRRSILALGITATVSACSTSKPKAQTPKKERPPYRGPLVRPENIPGDFLWQQRVSAKHADKSGAFDAVLQKQGAELLVLGLTPFGTRGFSLKQKGTHFEYEQYVPFELPFSPEAVLIDIHRTFFYALDEEALPNSGKREGSWESEALVDEFRKSRLVSRRYENVSGLSQPIEIAYSGTGYAPFEPPKKVTIKNRAYAYTLTVETESTQAL